MESDDSRSELASFLAPAKQAPIATCETLCDPEYSDVPTIKMDSSGSQVVIFPEDFGETIVDDINSNGRLIPPGGLHKALSSPVISECSTLEASSDTLTPGTPHSSPLSSPRRPSAPIKTPENYTPDIFSIFPKKISSPVKMPSPIMKSTSPQHSNRSPSISPKLRRAPSPISYSYSSPSIVAPQIKLRSSK